MSNEVTAIIVAREHSQRVAVKALQELHGATLLSRKIRQLQEAKRVNRVVVGSDSNCILNHAQERGAEGVRRPDYFCDESRASANEMIHNMCELVATDIVLWAHCTNPLLTSQTYDRALETFLRHEGEGRDSLLSVIKFQEHLWSSDKKPLNYNPYLPRHTIAKELAPLYVQDGGIFIQRHRDMLQNAYFFGKRPYLFEIPEDEYLDINTMKDLKIASALLTPPHEKIAHARRVKLLDCTLRDGGYYNSWDFASEFITEYMDAMSALNIDYMEIGFRSTKNTGFKGGCAFSTDAFITRLLIPEALADKIGVMVNGSELVDDFEKVLSSLFCLKKNSPVSLVRVACHAHEFLACLPAASWLQEQGYRVGFNLMQVTNMTEKDIAQLAQAANHYPIDVLYFADSLGSLTASRTVDIVHSFKNEWRGEMGIHAHNNMCQALANSMRAVEEGVTWVDGTVTGMGRGAGNAQTEYLTVALEQYRLSKGKTIKLLEIIRRHFKPMQNRYQWGPNQYYYLAGQYGIHPSYIQEMLSDSRYSEEDIIAIIDHLKPAGRKTFSHDTLRTAQNFYSGDARGSWNPAELFQNRAVLILGSGPGTAKYAKEIERFITIHQPFVIALNARQGEIVEHLINIRIACHPVRLLADSYAHLHLPQPLIIPASMLPEEVKNVLRAKKLLDYGICIQRDTFEFRETHCTIPAALVIAYTLAIVTSGKANRILLTGFDGYEADDPKRKEIDWLFELYRKSERSIPIISITPTHYEVEQQSIYAMLE